MHQKSEQEIRIEEVSSKCNRHYQDGTEVWSHDKERIRKYIAGQDIIDIGCGRNGGLARIVYDLGVKSYTGVDIDEEFINSSKRQIPEGLFICDDPIYVLDNLETQPLIISSALFDQNIILLNREYELDLIKAIFNSTAPGQVTMHTAGYFHEEFHNTFLSQGFKKLESRALMNIYKKTG